MSFQSDWHRCSLSERGLSTSSYSQWPADENLNGFLSSTEFLPEEPWDLEANMGAVHPATDEHAADLAMLAPACGDVPIPKFQKCKLHADIKAQEAQHDSQWTRIKEAREKVLGSRTYQATWDQPRRGKDAEPQATLRPDLQQYMLRSKTKSTGAPGWWTHSKLLCPLTGFPICLLPYPPFKLQVEHKLYIVDGKFLAMFYIVHGRAVVCGYELRDPDISALDTYLTRCKLGQFRPSRRAFLAREATHGTTMEQRSEAKKELQRFTCYVRTELGKLRCIQESRLLQIKKQLPEDVQEQLWCIQESKAESEIPKEMAVSTETFQA
eukprot:TRINITY_DN94925_c0_g1_i1.p1 TRINITY_DN94925_c0_g1~~TRINITY_DN94925_c0_g1_i1.p1  ORF type:complete len:324 (-),score=62.40 TRINITY_DN94925_c0_g1_i1:73-1044(-)